MLRIPKRSILIKIVLVVLVRIAIHHFIIVSKTTSTISASYHHSEEKALTTSHKNTTGIRETETPHDVPTNTDNDILLLSTELDYSLHTILYSSQIPIPSTCTRAYLIMPFVLVLVFAPPFYLIFRYRQSIKERLEEIEKGFFQFRVYREIKGTNDDTKRIRCLELNPAYVEEHRERWTLISLGEYLSQLRPGSEAPRFLKKELEIVIGSALIKYLGHSYGLA